MVITINRLIDDPATVDLDLDEPVYKWAICSIDTADISNIIVTRVKVREKTWEDVLAISTYDMPGIMYHYKPITESVMDGFFKIQKLQNEK